MRRFLIIKMIKHFYKKIINSIQRTLKTIKLKNNSVVVLMLILIIGGILRFYHLTFQSLWLDELITVCHSMPDYGFMNMIEHSSMLGKAPPFFYILLWLWQHIFGSSEFAVRILPVLFGIAGILGIYFLGAEIFSRKTGLFAAITTAFLSFHIYYSQETRSYSLLFLLASLSYLFLIKIIKQPNIKNIFLYVVITSMMLYTHYFVFFIFAAQIFFIVCYFLFSREFSFIKLLKSFGPAFIVPILLYIPWIPNLIKMGRLDSFWTHQPQPTFIIYYFKEFFGKETLLIILAGLLIATFIIDKKNKNKFKESKLLLLSWIMVSLMIPYLRSFNSPSPLTVRNAIVILPAILLMISRGLEKIKPISFQYFFLTLILFLLIINIFYTKGNYFQKYTKEQWRQLVESVILEDPDFKYPVYTIKYKGVSKYFDYYFNIVFKKNVSIRSKISDLESAESCYDDAMAGKITGFWLLEAHWFIDDSVRNSLEKNFFKKNEIVLHKARAALYIFNNSSLLTPEDWTKTGEEAIQIFKATISDNPSNPQVHKLWIKLGELYKTSKNFSASLDAIKNAVELEPKNADYRIILGDIYIELNSYEKALIEYKKAILIEPEYEKNFWSLLKLGKIYNQLGRFKEALHTFQKAWELDPKNSSVLRLLGNTYFFLGKIEQAFNSYQMALLKNPELEKESRFLLQLSHTLYLLNRYVEAKKFITKSLNLDPENTRGLQLLKNIESHIK